MVYHIRYTTSHLQQSCMNELVIPIDHELSIHYLKLIKIVFLPSSIFLGINVIVIQDLRFSQCMLMTEMSWLTKRELDQVTWKTIIFYSNIFYLTFAKKIIFSVDCFFQDTWTDQRYLSFSVLFFCCLIKEEKRRMLVSEENFSAKNAIINFRSNFHIRKII